MLKWTVRVVMTLDLPFPSQACSLKHNAPGGDGVLLARDRVSVELPPYLANPCAGLAPGCNRPRTTEPAAALVLTAKLAPQLGYLANVSLTPDSKPFDPSAQLGAMHSYRQLNNMETIGTRRWRKRSPRDRLQDLPQAPSRIAEFAFPFFGTSGHL